MQMITNIICRRSDSPMTSDKPHYPYELPKGWAWTTLGEISNYGTTINIQVDDIDKNEWILELEDIEKETANIIQRLSASERSVKGTRHKFSAGSILYSKLRTYLNKVLVAPSEGYCTTEIMPFDTYGIISNEYICHVLRSPFFLDYTLQCGYGVKMPRLSTTDACNGMIPLPPLNEQIRIVEAIKYWFVLIDIIESGKENLQETIKQAKSKILDLAIHGKLVPQAPTDEPASEQLKRINPKAEIISDNGHYQKLPEGWCETQLGDIFNHNTGKALNSSNTEGTLKDYLTTSNVYWNSFDFSVIKKMLFKESELNKCQITKGDLLVCEGGDIGRAAIWDYDYDICIQNHLHRLRPKVNGLCVSFYNYVLYYLKINNMIGGKGIGLLGLSSNALHKLHVPFPSLNEQHRIVSKIEEIFAQLDAIEALL